MQRRTFVHLGATALSTLPLQGFAAVDFNATKPQWIVDLIKLNDQGFESLFAAQVVDSSKQTYGAIKDGDSIPNVQSTGHFVSKSAIALANMESKFYQSVDLLKKVDLAAQYLLKAQHNDGTIDLLSTNFHSPPDTAFSVEKLAPAYTFIKTSKTKGAEPVLNNLKTFLQRAGESLIVGGIHTPNHRWVVSAALTKLNELWPDPRYVKRAEQWLLEHIDLDPDGQYTEKSTGGYTPLVNRVLIIMANGLKKPEILDAVRKNLNMTLYYVHPNGEVVTEASNRQDKGTIGTLENYYFSYRYLALLDNNGQYAAMCRLIEKSCFPKMVSALDAYLENPALWKELPADQALPTSYARAFPHSGVARIRRGNWDATILSNNPGFVTFQKGKAVLQGLRIAASFFGKGQFQAAEIKQEGNAWILSNQLDGPYYQPYPSDQIDPMGDLSKMPRTNRQKSEVQHLNYTVKISEIEGGIAVDFDLQGTEGVPVSLELIFRPGGTLGDVEALAAKPKAYELSGKSGTYTQDGDVIHFGPGQVEHHAVQLRGALPPMDAPTVYVTGFTPFRHRITLT